MRKLFVVAFLLCLSGATGQEQNHKVRISIAGNSNVSAAGLGKSLDSHCAEVSLTLDAQKADYLLEAIYTGAGPARKPYKFTLFSHDGDRIFSTETARLDNAVKDVCAFIRKQEQ